MHAMFVRSAKSDFASEHIPRILMGRFAQTDVDVDVDVVYFRDRNAESTKYSDIKA